MKGDIADIPDPLYRVFVRLGYREKAESTKKKSKHLGHYDTPTLPGKKCQMDVKVRKINLSNSRFMSFIAQKGGAMIPLRGTGHKSG